MTTLPARGEIWWCELPEIGRRPVIVLSRDAAIPRLRRALIGPCTTVIRGIPTEVVLQPPDDPIPRLSAANLDSVESVSLGTLVAFLLYSGRFFRPISDMSEKFNTLQAAMASSERLPAIPAVTAPTS